ERCPPAGLAVASYISPMLGDNAKYHGQAKTCTFCAGLCCEKWLEYAVQNLWRHAQPGIRDGQEDVFTRYSAQVGPEVLIANRYVPSLHEELSPIRHGMLSVNSQVENYLLDLRWI